MGVEHSSTRFQQKQRRSTFQHSYMTMCPVGRGTLLLLIAGLRLYKTEAFSLESPGQRSPTFIGADDFVGSILILDHLNINHEKGRHDWLKAFYFEWLRCVPDPRKAENLETGRKTLWANIGAQQFHLPEGKPDAQRLEGITTLVYPGFDGLLERLGKASTSMEGSCFQCFQQPDDASLLVTDPWGSRFRIVGGSENVDRDQRGQQDGGEQAEGFGMRDLCIYTDPNANLAGIARFYERIFQAPVKVLHNKAVVTVGPRQTLTFMPHPDGKKVRHDDMRYEDGEELMSNYGPHISIYVANLSNCYQRADELGLVYVNPRFKRRASSLEEALDQCMFRCLDIVDPEQPQEGPILRLEHEVRSVVKKDGSMYKSCPFNEIPDVCTQ